MRTLGKFLAFLILLAVICGGVAWIWAGRQPGPTVEFRQPDRFVGQSSDARADGPGAAGTVLATRGRASSRAASRIRSSASSNRRRRRQGRTRPIASTSCGRSARRAIPALQQGPRGSSCARRGRCSTGCGTRRTEATRDVQVRLEPPQASVLSTFHYVNLGGAEFVVYRATPADVESGVRVGDRTYPGFPATAVGVQDDPALHVAFFALSYDQDVNTPISVFATRPGRQHRASRPSITWRSRSRSRAARFRSTTGSRASCRPSSRIRPR